MFDNDKALATFLSIGWSASGQTDAAAGLERRAEPQEQIRVAPGGWFTDYQEWSALQLKHFWDRALRTDLRTEILSLIAETELQKTATVHVCQKRGHRNTISTKFAQASIRSVSVVAVFNSCGLPLRVPRQLSEDLRVRRHLFVLI